MVRKSILVLVSAAVIGLVALAGIAVAGMDTDDKGSGTVDAVVMESTTTTSTDDHDDTSMESTPTTMADNDDDPSKGSTPTTMADVYDDTSTESTPTPMADDYDDRSIVDGVETIDVSPAGSISVEVKNGMLYLTSIDIESTWMLAKRDEQSEQFELLFYWGESELKVKVEIDSGYLKKMIEFDMKND